MRRYVITGGPGVGKTTVVEILAARGYVVVPEAARMIIEEESAKGGAALPWKDLSAFQEIVADRQLAQEEAAAGTAFLDRSIVDGYAYCVLGGVEAPKAIENNARGRYDKVFMLAPLPLYETDSVRLEDKETGARIHAEIARAYAHFGYAPVDIPVLSPQERVDMILWSIS